MNFEVFLTVDGNVEVTVTVPIIRGSLLIETSRTHDILLAAVAKPRAKDMKGSSRKTGKEPSVMDLRRGKETTREHKPLRSVRDTYD